MENFSTETPQEMTDNNGSGGLWLTDQLISQLRSSAGLGVPLMVMCLILGISSALLTLYGLWLRAEGRSRDFYLLEDGNLFKTINLLASSIILYFFARGVLEGHKAWRLLRLSETDDQALLEGSERLAKMFRWFALWGGAYVVAEVAERVLGSAM